MIHGAWHGGWCFDALRPLLGSAGHRLIAPTLPGMGSGDATLAGWADFAADLAREQAAPVILCGHSRGGIVISEAAERAPEAIAALVYITAFLLPSGRSFVEEVGAHPRDPAFQNALRPTPDGAALMIDPEGSKPILFNRTAPDLADAVAARLVAEPLAPATTRLRLSAERYGRVPRVYIECGDDQAIPPAHARSMQAREPCERVMTIDSDHSPFLSSPEIMANMLCDIAAAYTPGA